MVITKYFLRKNNLFVIAIRSDKCFAQFIAALGIYKFKLIDSQGTHSLSLSILTPDSAKGTSLQILQKSFSLLLQQFVPLQP